jgi:LysR substrate binding domain
MVLIVIFSVRKTDRSSNKDGSGYEQNRHEVLPFRVFRCCCPGVEFNPCSRSFKRFSAAVQQANPRPGRRAGCKVFRAPAQRSHAHAGKSFLIDARRILEDCGASIRKAQRISRGEIGELAIGYTSAMTHDFLAKALEVWRLHSPGIIVDCVEMDSVSQERALFEGRISVGILVPSDRTVLELLHIRLLIKYPASLALPKSHPHANRPGIWSTWI